LCVASVRVLWAFHQCRPPHYHLTNWIVKRPSLSRTPGIAWRFTYPIPSSSFFRSQYRQNAPHEMSGGSEWSQCGM